MIQLGVSRRRHTVLVGLIAYDVHPAGVRARESDDVVIRIPGPLPLLTGVQRERLGLDRTGAVDLRPRNEKSVVWNARRACDRKRGACIFRTGGRLIAASGK